MKNKVKVYCIIVTYNGMKWIEKCLSSLKEDAIDLTIVVVDNNSDDETVTFIKTNFPEVKIVESDINLGFGKANNLGWQMAKQADADYVYLLNQDTISYPNNICKLIKIAELDHAIGVVSPMHLNDTGIKLDAKFEGYITAKSCPNYITDVTLGQLQQFYTIGFVNAAAWLVKTNTIDYLGGLFSSAFFHYGEDVNFIGRLRYFNFKSVIVPNVFIHHCREERKGQLSSKFINKHVDLNKVAMMHDIKSSYVHCAKDVARYALQQLTKGNFLAFVKLSCYPIVSFKTISAYRKSYKKRKLFF
ncbi:MULTISPECIES: glycosyltransferase family 2 protein [Flavobacterium]|uniref:glycosyltransferase family 2 protein n=1 Tax=Flavobacterium TaxID=237 RepID=UPI001FCB061E|nr:MULTISPECIES: glycosyltransferase family 2 protein [Flavobacterium]UOK43753.1 glycosyltransferase family 2 protein [Flavobacterium enshiense]